MPQSANLYRRSSGIYAMRLVVPERHRATLGRGEVHVSTSSRTLAVAKAVGAALLAHWREKFLSLDRLPKMDVERVTAGSPALGGTGHLRLSEAAAATGVDEDHLLREAVEGRLRLFVRLSGTWGYVIPEDALEGDPDLSAGSFSGHTAPLLAEERHFIGLAGCRDSIAVATALLTAAECILKVFDQARRNSFLFVAHEPVGVARSCIEVLASEVEAFRLIMKARITPEQAKLATAHARQSRGKSARRLSEALTSYMADKRRKCKADHARRIQSACQLVINSEGDLQLGDVDRDRLRRFVSAKLPRLPAAAHNAKAVHGEHIPAEWPRLSQAEQHFRVMCIQAMFKWLKQEGWVAENPAEGLTALVVAAPPARRKRGQDARSMFTIEELWSIFSWDYFASGKGTLTSAGTYREFAPHYYWLPLLGLFTGARINELCQLYLNDIQRLSDGTWAIRITDEAEGQSLKNVHSKRLLPMHPTLVTLGLPSWTQKLAAHGHERLFPELRFDQTKGFSKDAVKWFSRTLDSLGWKRDGTKTFHSFRHGFVNACVNDLGLDEATVNQLTGHERGQSILMNVYRKDKLPGQLIEAVGRIRFALPAIAPFDEEAGLVALRHALDRKKDRAAHL